MNIKKIIELARELEHVTGNPIDTLSKEITKKVTEHQLPYQISCIMCCEQKECKTYKKLVELVQLERVFKNDIFTSTATQCYMFSFIDDIVFTNKIKDDHFYPHRKSLLLDRGTTYHSPLLSPVLQIAAKHHKLMSIFEYNERIRSKNRK